MASPLRAALSARIARHGPLAYGDYVDAVLYDPEHGYYAGGPRAGRRGDFLTSPEVGQLFGAVLARALDAWWDDLGRPEPFVVVEAGAGTGTLARAVLAADPRCSRSLRYVLVERSDALREAQRASLPVEPAAEAFAVAGAGSGDDGDEDAVVGAPPRSGPVVVSLPTLPALAVTGVVLANELLDNLAFDLLERHAGGWSEVRVGDDGGGLVEVLVPAAPEDAELAQELAAATPVGGRVPLQREAARWVGAALERLASGRLVVLDYAATTPELAGRPWADWVRTYRQHQRGRGPLDDPGEQDVTCEVCVDQLARVRRPDRDRHQAQFLVDHGMDALVAEGRQLWHQRAALGDLRALQARSRVREAEALSDPDGLGAFRVLEWAVGEMRP